MCIYQRVSAVGVVEVPIFIYLHTICNHVTGGRSIKLLRLELKVVMQKDGDIMDVSQLYLHLHTNCHFSVPILISINSVQDVLDNYFNAICVPIPAITLGSLAGDSPPKNTSKS